MTHILLIEDDELIRESLSIGLEDGGYTVTLAADGKEGTALLDKIVVDLVITDLVMPEMEGIEVIQHIKQKFPNQKIIGISGGGRNSATTYLNLAETLGADAVLQKPFTIGALREKIEGILA